MSGITKKKHQKTFAEFKSLFEEAGFTLFEDMLDALSFGVPQHRQRVFVVGINSKKHPGVRFVFPTGSAYECRTVASVIQGLPEPVFYRRGLDPDGFAVHPNHWTMQPKSKKFKNGFLKNGNKRRRSFRVLSWDKPSWTVAYGNREIHIHPSGTRRLSIYEAMLLQGFPRRYRLWGTFSEQVTQVSDAIPWQVGRALAKQIALFLGGSEKARQPLIDTDLFKL